MCTFRYGLTDLRLVWQSSSSLESNGQSLIPLQRYCSSIQGPFSHRNIFKRHPLPTSSSPFFMIFNHDLAEIVWCGMTVENDDDDDDIWTDENWIITCLDIALRWEPITPFWMRLNKQSKKCIAHEVKYTYCSNVHRNSRRNHCDHYNNPTKEYNRHLSIEIPQVGIHLTSKSMFFFVTYNALWLKC